MSKSIDSQKLLKATDFLKDILPSSDGFDYEWLISREKGGFLCKTTYGHSHNEYDEDDSYEYYELDVNVHIPDKSPSDFSMDFNCSKEILELSIKDDLQMYFEYLISSRLNPRLEDYIKLVSSFSCSR